MSLQTTLLLACPLLLGGCAARAVDLGHDEGRWAISLDSADSQGVVTLYQGPSRVAGLAVDETHLYAELEAIPGAPSGLTLVSCEFSSCAGTLGEMAKIAYPSGRLLLSEGELFWWDTLDDASRLVSCPVAGCPSGPHLLTNGGAPRIAADADNIYWLQGYNRIARCARAGCTQPELVHEDSPYSHWDYKGRIAIAGDFLYVQYTGQDHTVFRVRRDGSGDETVAYEGSLVGSIATNADNLFVATSVLTGTMLRCPIDGCSGPPDVLATGQAWPIEMVLDDAIYWFNTGTGPDRGSLVTCPLEGGATRVLASNLWFSRDLDIDSSHLATNSRYVFWTEYHYDQDLGWLSTIKAVRK
jgi:hypothetical protein